MYAIISAELTCNQVQLPDAFLIAFWHRQRFIMCSILKKIAIIFDMKTLKLNRQNLQFWG